MKRLARASTATCVVAVMTLLSQATLARADALPTKAISLADALSYARVTQPAVRAALARIEASKARAEVPRAQWYPVFGATAQLFGGSANNTTGSYVGVGFIDIPRMGGTRVVSPSNASWVPSASTLVGVGLTQELFDFGRIAAQTAAADLEVDVVRHSADALRLDVDFNVTEAYFAVYAAKSVLIASEGGYARSKVHRDLAKAGVESGLRSPIELTRAESELSHFDVGRIRARGGVVIAQSTLAAAIGSPESALDVLGEAPSAADLPSIDDALTSVIARDPTIGEQIAVLKAQEQHTKAIGAELRPDISLTSTLSGRAGGATPSGSGDVALANGFLPAVPNWDVGLIISWPIFVGTVHARQDASRAQEQVEREEVALATQALRASVQQAFVSAKVARDALPALKEAVDAAVANYAQAEARFKADIGNAVELADAEALRAEAEIQLALGIFEVARSRASLGRALAEGL